MIIPGFLSQHQMWRRACEKQQLCVDAPEIRSINKFSPSGINHGNLNLTPLVCSQTAQTRSDIFLMLHILNV